MTEIVARVAELEKQRDSGKVRRTGTKKWTVAEWLAHWLTIVREIKAILAEAGKRRNHVRWAIALALGLRQGEALGLKWSDIDLDAGVLRVRRSLNRPKYKHGCDNGSCGRSPGRCAARQLARPRGTPPRPSCFCSVFPSGLSWM